MADVDVHLKYLLLTVAIIAVVGAWHNANVSPDDVRSIGMCDQELVCNGYEAGDICLGIEQRDISCVDFQNASDWRRAEAECALKAQSFCNANQNFSNMDWTDHPNASWGGKTCTQWAEQDDRIELLSCDETFNDITNWDEQQG